MGLLRGAENERQLFFDIITSKGKEMVQRKYTSDNFRSCLYIRPKKTLETYGFWRLFSSVFLAHI